MNAYTFKPQDEIPDNPHRRCFIFLTIAMCPTFPKLFASKQSPGVKHRIGQCID